MTPGSELDALIAEKVMGWKDPEGISLALRDGRVVNTMDGVSWSPSTDIAAAWEVVGRVRERGFEVYVLGNPKTPWGCRIWDGNQEMGFVRSAESAPHAICLAALKAVGA